MAFIIPEEPPQPKLYREKKPRRSRRGRRRANSSDGSTSSSSASPQNNSKQNRPTYKIMSAHQQAKYVAMDCEMVGVGEHGQSSALARVTIVNWNCETIYDEFVKPSEPITDYRTFVSGITSEHLVNAVDLYTCRARVATILHGKILVGHGLKNDLDALQLCHPWQSIRDTSLYEPFQKVRFADGVLWPRKLKDLCAERLAIYIQQPGKPHSAYEDAVAALKLYKSVRPKWEKGMGYKIKKTTEMQRQQQHQYNAALFYQQYYTLPLPLPLPPPPIAFAV